MKYLYGPVVSRRLGKSLGINVTPYKTCTYSCVYCQLGYTTNKTVERKSYFDKNEILKEIKSLANRNISFDYLTFAGEGEPTLNKDLGVFIAEAKKYDLKVAVLTNGSLLWRSDVRNDLFEADVVIPSLDAASQDTFKKINRPHESLVIDRIIDGLSAFSEEFDGKFYIEIMLVKGYNTHKEELTKIKEAIEKIKPDGVYLMIPTRPPTEKIEIPDYLDIIKAETIIGKVTKILKPEVGEISLMDDKNPKEGILSIIRRHPLRRDQLLELLKKYGLKMEEIENEIEEMEFNNVKYYVISSKKKS